MLSLLTELRDFVSRHRVHGKLAADASEPDADGDVLTVECPCGVTFMRWMMPGEVAREIVLSQLLSSEN